jgi:hypothetical protein
VGNRKSGDRTQARDSPRKSRRVVNLCGFAVDPFARVVGEPYGNSRGAGTPRGSDRKVQASARRGKWPNELQSLRKPRLLGRRGWLDSLSDEIVARVIWPTSRHYRLISAHLQGVARLRASTRILVRRLEIVAIASCSRSQWCGSLRPLAPSCEHAPKNMIIGTMEEAKTFLSGGKKTSSIGCLFVTT